MKTNPKTVEKLVAELHAFKADAKPIDWKMGTPFSSEWNARCGEAMPQILDQLAALERFKHNVMTWPDADVGGVLPSTIQRYAMQAFAHN